MPPGVFKLKVQNIYWKVKILEFKVGSLCWNLSRGVGVLVALESCCLAETKPGPYLVADLANVHSHASSPDPGPKTSAWFVDTRSTTLVFDPLSLISSTSLSHMLSLVWLDNNHLIFELPSNTIFYLVWSLEYQPNKPSHILITCENIVTNITPLTNCFNYSPN